MRNDIVFFFIFLLPVPLHESNAHLPIASTLVENINNLENYVLPSFEVLHLRGLYKSVENIVFFFFFFSSH